MDEPPITIRPAKTIADYIACQDAQRKAWGLPDESYVVPLATMVGAAHHGGLVLGAFLPDGMAVGVSFAFLGRSGEPWCLYSQLTGVIPGYQGRGIGSKIKEFQRDYARSIGLDFIAWAFDPLQAGNAYLNLHRLGATSHRYIENMYGPRTDARNVGVPTDRLIAEWPTKPAPPRRETVAASESPRLVEGPDEPRREAIDSLPESPVLLVEIPGSILQVRTDNPASAERWRFAVATAMNEAFATGYRAVDVIREEGRVFYLLDRQIDLCLTESRANEAGCTDSRMNPLHP